MDFFKHIADISSWIALVAFIVAVAGVLITRLISKSVTIIKSAPEKDRAPLIEKALDRDKLTANGLTRMQKFKLLQQRIGQQPLPWVVAIVVAFLLALVIIIGIVASPSSDRPSLPSPAKSSGTVELQMPPIIRPARVGETLVLVADFDGPEPKRYRIADNIIRHLRAELGKEEIIRVEALRLMISEQSGGSKAAKVLGDQFNAAVVIWGWYGLSPTTVQISVNFEVLRLPYMTPSLCASQRVTDLVNDSISKFYSFTLQSTISNRMAFLAQFASGMAAYLARDWEGAIEHFTGALAEADDGTPASDLAIAHFFRAQCFNKRAQTLLAIEDYREAVRQYPSPAAHYELGLLFSDGEDSAVAIGHLSKAINLAPDYELAYYQRGILRKRADEIAGARADFTQALALDGETVVAQAINDLQLNKDDMEVVLRDCSHPEASAPDYLLLRGVCGYLQVEARQYSDAIPTLTQILKSDSHQHWAHSLLGLSYYGIGRFDAAHKELEEAVALQPRKPCAYVNRSLFREHEKDWDGALADLNKAISLDSEEYSAYVNRARLFQKKGRIEDAIADISAAIALRPDDPSLYLRRGAYKYSIGQLAPARSDLDKYILEYPHSHQALMMRAVINYNLGEMDKASLDLDRLISDKARTTEAYAFRASILLKEGMVEQALDDLNRAVDAGSFDSRVYVTRGWILGVRLDLDKAERDFDTALILEKGHARAKFGKVAVRAFPAVAVALSLGFILQLWWSIKYLTPMFMGFLLGGLLACIVVTNVSLHAFDLQVPDVHRYEVSLFLLSVGVLVALACAAGWNHARILLPFSVGFGAGVSVGILLLRPYQNNLSWTLFGWIGLMLLEWSLVQSLVSFQSMRARRRFEVEVPPEGRVGGGRDGIA